MCDTSPSAIGKGVSKELFKQCKLLPLFLFGHQIFRQNMNGEDTTHFATGLAETKQPLEAPSLMVSFLVAISC